MKIKLAVYGTLSGGMGLHDRYLMDEEPLETIEIKGFQMLNFGYPIVIPSDNREDSIIAEIYEVEMFDLSILRMFSMEIGASYHVGILPDRRDVYIFLQHDNRHNLPIIESGDFVKHIKEKYESNT